jgi:predicted HicB family RNase H-like nuclease
MPKRPDESADERQGLMIRMPRDLHRALRHLSVDRGVPLNTLILQAIDEWWQRQPEHGRGAVAGGSRISKNK